jgi:hypothetical protein
MYPYIIHPNMTWNVASLKQKKTYTILFSRSVTVHNS